MPELGSQQHPSVDAFVERTADLGPEARALAAQTVIDADQARTNRLAIAGFIEANAGASAVATNKGLFAYHASTDASMSTTARTPDGTGSGYAVAGSRNWGDINAASLGRRAADKALASRNPQAIEPGMYTVVLEPQAVSDVLPLLAGSFNARSTDEGRSAFAKPGGTKLGEKIADERVTIYSDPADRDLLMRPFDNEGLPLRRITWIENGILKNLAYSRFWADKKGVQPTGGGGGGGGGGFGGGLPGGLKMLGGTQSVDELVAGPQRGILVTRFWYIRFLDQRTVMVTGLTRDGTFLSENGKITRPLKHLRWTESPLLMLNKIEELGKAERVEAGRVVPSLRVRDWNFTSLSDAV